MPITANDFSAKVAEYKYFVTNIVTNEILAEIPFADVSFERALKGSGSFDGTIAVTADTEDLDLYENTMPGKTAVYVTRNGLCVWGGIIWGRDYNIINRQLKITASEFTSYLYHRVIWKTYNYDLEAKAYKTTASGNVRIELTTRTSIVFPSTDTAGNRTKVYVSFGEQGYTGYSGFQEILESPAPSAGQFYVTIDGLPARPDSYYSKVTISARVDTYQYVRELLQEVFEDFTDVEFANELIEPGVKEGFNVTYRSISSEVATITTDTDHNLIAGQRVEIVNVHSSLDGTWVVTEVPTSTSFKFSVPGAGNLSLNGSALSSTSYPLKYRRVTDVSKRNVTKVSRLSNVVTITTTTSHGYQVGDLVILDIQEKYKDFNDNGAAKTITSTPTTKTFTYSLTGDDTVDAGIKVTDSYVNYSVPKKVLELTTYSGYPHAFLVNDEVYVYGADDPAWGAPMYSGYSKVTAKESGGSPTWFQYNTQFDMTVEPGSIAPIASRKYTYKNSNNVIVKTVTITTAGSHGFNPGDVVEIDTQAKAGSTDAAFDGTHTIKDCPSDISFTYIPTTVPTKSVVNQKITGSAKRIKAVISSIDRSPVTITQVRRVGTTATITTSTAHNFVEKDVVVVEASDTSFNNSGGPVLITDVSSTTKFSYYSPGTATPLTSATGTAAAVYSDVGKVYSPTSAQVVNAGSGTGTVRIITCPDHDFKVGEWVVVYIENYASRFNNLNVPVQITAVSAGVSFTYSLASSATAATITPGSNSTVTRAAYATKQPRVYGRSYGEFPNNTDLGGIEFSDTTYSQKAFLNSPLRGGDLTVVGEHLDKYSNTPEGFDYRIDCSLDTSSGVGVFKRTFSLVPRTPASLTEYLAANPLAAGEYAPPSAFGADQLTFEYPGNVSDVSLQENAENSVTRMFIIGDGAGSGGGDASARYSAAASTDLLSNGWPILDASEKQEWPIYGYNKINVDNYGNYDVESDLNKTAKRFLNESKPPMGEYSIKINGSLDPVVGSYNPGDWCQLVINDEFISKRLNSYLEPRSNVILRKIESIKVSVPNSPAFPEQITLNLIPEWEVDKHG